MLGVFSSLKGNGMPIKLIQAYLYTGENFISVEVEGED
jgi:hypothetical protein